MNCSEFERQIDDFVDGGLDERDRRRVELHLENCPDCRQSVEGLDALLAEAAALPRGIEPPRDLFPGIRDRLESHRGPGISFRRGGDAPRVPWVTWVGLAASVLVLVTAAILLPRVWNERDRASNPSVSDGTAQPASHIATNEFRAAEAEYLRATRLLMDTLEKNEAELSPEAAAVIEENLAVIDRAIEEVRSALADDPANARNGQVLTALHRQKLQLLMRASRLSS
jgi:anti-sigma factor RsiW